MSEFSKKLLLSVATLVLLFPLLEVGTRLFVEPVSRQNFTRVPSTLAMLPTIPDVPVMLRRNGTGTQEFGSDPRGYFDEGATLTYRTNGLGFRGPATTRWKPPETVRVVGLGDSFTFGTGVRREHTFLAVLERTLNERGDGARVEVLNLGVPGWNTVNEISLLKHLAITYDPDLVVICFVLNDTGGATRPLFFELTEQKELPAWRRLSRFLDWVTTRLEQRRVVRKQVESYEASYRDDSAGWIAARRALRDAKTLSEERGFELVLMIFPVLWKLSDSYPFAVIHRTVASFARDQQIRVLDLLPAFTGFDGPELWVHPNNQHPNEQAHARAAEALYGFLIDDELLASDAHRSPSRSARSR